MNLSKTEQLKIFIKEEDWHNSLKIAKNFKLLKLEDKKIIGQAWEALQNPNFYKQIGKDPEILIQKGIEVIKKLYS